jgi:hypothetical protein
MHSEDPGEDPRNWVHLSRCRACQDVQDQTRDGKSGRERRGGSMGDPSRTLSRANQFNDLPMQLKFQAPLPRMDCYRMVPRIPSP